MKVVDTITVDELHRMSEKMYGSIVKADVDIVQNVLTIDMDMHADGEAYLLENGSRQEDIWGINLLPGKFGMADFIEYDSMINIRPRQKNPTRTVLDDTVRQKIQSIIETRVHE